LTILVNLVYINYPMKYEITDSDDIQIIRFANDYYLKFAGWNSHMTLKDQYSNYYIS
jgi:hypothetical protein